MGRIIPSGIAFQRRNQPRLHRVAKNQGMTPAEVANLIKLADTIANSQIVGAGVNAVSGGFAGGGAAPPEAQPEAAAVRPDFADEQLPDIRHQAREVFSGMPDHERQAVLQAQVLLQEGNTPQQALAALVQGGTDELVASKATIAARRLQEMGLTDLPLESFAEVSVAGPVDKVAKTREVVANFLARSGSGAEAKESLVAQGVRPEDADTLIAEAAASLQGPVKPEPSADAPAFLDPDLADAARALSTGLEPHQVVRSLMNGGVDKADAMARVGAVVEAKAKSAEEFAAEQDEATVARRFDAAARDARDFAQVTGLAKLADTPEKQKRVVDLAQRMARPRTINELIFPAAFRIQVATDMERLFPADPEDAELARLVKLSQIEDRKSRGARREVSSAVQVAKLPGELAETDVDVRTAEQKLKEARDTENARTAQVKAVSSQKVEEAAQFLRGEFDLEKAKGDFRDDLIRDQKMLTDSVDIFQRAAREAAAIVGTASSAGDTFKVLTEQSGVRTEAAEIVAAKYGLLNMTAPAAQAQFEQAAAAAIAQADVIGDELDVLNGVLDGPSFKVYLANFDLSALRERKEAAGTDAEAKAKVKAKIRQANP